MARLTPPDVPADDGGTGSEDGAGRGYLVLLAVLVVVVVATEACLVLPGHLLAAQIVDAVLVLLLVNVGPRSPSELSDRGTSAIVAMRMLALVPLLRVVALGLPMRNWHEAVAVMLLAIAFIVAVLRIAPVAGISRRRFVDFDHLTSQLIAAGAGAVLGFVAYLGGAPELWGEAAAPKYMAFALAAAAAAAIAEELVFRGVLQLTFQRAAGASGSIAASAVFAAMYLDAGTPTLVLTYALAGFVFAYSVSRSSVLGGAIAGHVLLALGAGAAWPLLLGKVPPFELPQTPTLVALTMTIAAAAAATHGALRSSAVRLEP